MKSIGHSDMIHQECSACSINRFHPFSHCLSLRSPLFVSSLTASPFFIHSEVTPNEWLQILPPLQSSTTSESESESGFCSLVHMCIHYIYLLYTFPFAFSSELFPEENSLRKIDGRLIGVCAKSLEKNQTFHSIPKKKTGDFRCLLVFDQFSDSWNQWQM